jgi:hypothetical protein
MSKHSSSLIDLILTNNVNRLIYTGVGPALTDQIRYHCPVIGFINYPKTPTKPFKRKIWLYGILFFFCLINFRILQDNHLGPPFRIVTILLGIEDSAALKIALVISFVINSISSMISKEQTYLIYIFQNNPKLTTLTAISLIYYMLQTK